MEISLVSQGKKPQHMLYKSGFWCAMSNQVSHLELRVKSMGMDNSDRKAQLLMIQLQTEKLTKTSKRIVIFKVGLPLSTRS